MRTGPAKTYPAKWLYRRADLPIKVLEVYPNWRRIQDPSGERAGCWSTLLSETRTAIVTGEEPRRCTKRPARFAGALSRPAGRRGRISNARPTGASLSERPPRLHQHRHIWGTDPARPSNSLRFARGLANAGRMDEADRRLRARLLDGARFSSILTGPWWSLPRLRTRSAWPGLRPLLDGCRAAWTVASR
jgi:hypothetical protein